MSLPRLHLPVWARWSLSLGIGVILFIALVVFVDHNSNNSEATQSPQAVARANREAEIVVEQDQAPHVARVTPGQSPLVAARAAVRADVNTMINKGIIDGTLTRTRCATTHRRAGRVAFACTAVVASVNYPFVGVVDVPARRVTYCKHDEPPVPSMNIPVSPRCTSV